MVNNRIFNGEFALVVVHHSLCLHCNYSYPVYTIVVHFLLCTAEYCILIIPYVCPRTGKLDDFGREWYGTVGAQVYLTLYNLSRRVSDNTAVITNDVWLQHYCCK